MVLAVVWVLDRGGFAALVEPGLPFPIRGRVFSLPLSPGAILTIGAPFRPAYAPSMTTREKREVDARAAANEYAPAPQGSAVTYGVIGVLLLGLTLWGVARFYDVSFLRHPVVLAACAVVVFVFGMGLRKWRKRRHSAAYQTQFAQSGEKPAEASRTSPPMP